MSYQNHAWKHRPKSQGGTDPIDMPGGITWCVAKGFNDLVDAGSDYPWVFSQLFANDSTTFEPFIQGGDFTFVQINQPGYYVGKFYIAHGSSTFPTGNDLFLEPMFLFGGVRSSMVQNMDDPDFVGIRFNSPAEQLAAGPARGGLYTELAFNWDPANVTSDFNSENPLCVSGSVALAGGPGTIPAVYHMWLARIADEGYVDLSPV